MDGDDIIDEIPDIPEPIRSTKMNEIFPLIKDSQPKEIFRCKKCSHMTCLEDSIKQHKCKKKRTKH